MEAVPADSLAAVCRSYEAADRYQVKKLLSGLPALYPNGDTWLERRLGELQDPGPRCTVVQRGPEIVGVAIETPKPRNRLKLSTLFIATGARREGHGSHLLAFLCDRWDRESLDVVTVTAAQELMPGVGAFFETADFEHFLTALDRYGLDRHEVVMRRNRRDAPAFDSV